MVHLLCSFQFCFFKIIVYQLKLLYFLPKSWGHPFAIYKARAFYRLFIWTILIFSVSSCHSNVHDTVSLLQALGFHVNAKKSVLIPTQTLEFLGFILDSVNMTITLTPRRQTNIAEVCQQLLQKPSHKFHFVSMVIGMLIAALPAVQHGDLPVILIEGCMMYVLMLF